MLSMYRMKWWGIAALVSVMISMAGCSGASNQQTVNQPNQPGTAETQTNTGTPAAKAQGEPKKGGTIRVAVDADPPTLDWMSSPSSATTAVAYHLFEQLFTLDQNLTIKPMLAKDYKISEDKKTYTIQLREGVKFHDGSAMNAEDVVASMNRWGVLSGVGRTMFNKVQEVRANGEYTVEILLKEPYAPVLANMADPTQSLAVIPAEMAKQADKNPLEDHQVIGTGPYQFESWKRGQQIVLKRFDDYVSREEDWGGLTGKKVAYADKIQFHIVKDTQVRFSGLQTGQFDYAVRMPKDLFEAIKGSPGMKAITSRPDSWLTVVPDKSQPPFDDVRLRQAINYALDKDKIGQGTYGPKDFYEVDGSIFFPDQKDLYTTDGTEGYNVYNPEKAKELMKEAGYTGKTVKLIATNSFDDHNNAAQVLMHQLKEVGFNVELQYLEWATFLNQVNDPNNFDMFVTGFPPTYDLTGVLWINPKFPGLYTSPKMSALVEQWSKTVDPGEQKRILGEVNKLTYEELPVIKFINEIGLEAMSDKLDGFQGWLSYRFWNVGVATP